MEVITNVEVKNTCYNCTKKFWLQPILYNSGCLFCDKSKDRPRDPHEMVGWNPSDKNLGYEKWEKWAQEHVVKFNNFCSEHVVIDEVRLKNKGLCHV